MKDFFKIIFLIIFLQIGFSEYAIVYGKKLEQAINDTTSIENETIANKKIDEVIKSPTPPVKEEVQYVTQVTKYGFKNLFTNYSYNPAIPYSSQVNPHAESYMQDYLHAHGKYLQQLKLNSMSYFNFIDGILSQYGLPKELKYLAVIESNLSS